MKQIFALLHEIEELLNQVQIANTLQQPPQVEEYCTKLGGALMELTIRLCHLEKEVSA